MNGRRPVVSRGKNAGTMTNRLICSIRDSLPSAVSTAAPIAARMAG